MAAGIRPTRIEDEGWAIPDEVSIDAVYTGDDADWDEAPGVGGQDQWKQPVRCATTASVTIATALNAGDTIDGVTLAAGDRVLVKDQGTASENGIYVAGATPVRAADMDADEEVLGAAVYVIAGTANAGTGWSVTNTAATIVDTDAIDWAAFGGSTGVGALDDLTDVNAPSPSDEHVLTWDAGAGEWIAAAAPSGSGIPATLIDAKGDLIVGSAADTAARLAVGGTNGHVLTVDSAETLGVKWAAPASGPGSILAPPVVQTSAAYVASGTTNAVTLGATPTKTLIATVSSGSRGATSISQTNVTWTQLYTGNGGSQYAEVWTGTITGAAGTTVTANFASATRSELAVYEVDHADFTTVGTAVTTTTTLARLFAGPLSSPTLGDICIIVCAMAGANDSIGGMSVPFISGSVLASGSGFSALFYHTTYAEQATRQISSSVAWFSAMMKIS